MQVEDGAGSGASRQPQPKHGIELRQIQDGRKKSAGSRGVGAGEDNPGFLDEGGEVMASFERLALESAV